MRGERYKENQKAWPSEKSSQAFFPAGAEKHEFEKWKKIGKKRKTLGKEKIFFHR